MFIDPILTTYSRHAELAGLLDKDKGRIESFNKSRSSQVHGFTPDQFDKMVEQVRPDVIIVACQDSLHDEYVIKALQHDLDVISEKPLTTDQDKCLAIAKAAAESKGKVTVTFNCRYMPATTKIKELIVSGRLGRIVSLDLNWYLDTRHGATYFQRWHRQREYSGGLTLHKSCHHLDMVKWWLDQRPDEAFAFSALNFYGPKGVHNPLSASQTGDGRTCLSCDMRQRCPYYMQWHREEHRKGVTLDNLHEHVPAETLYDNYVPRKCLFDPQINIEDTYGAVIRYDGGTIVSYTLNCSMPYEGYRLGITGTEGRIDYTEFHGAQGLPFPYPDHAPPVEFTPLFGGRETIEIINRGGSHGGGDPLLLDELFAGPDPLAPVPRNATLRDGIDAVLTGVAVYTAGLENRPVSIRDMRAKIDPYLPA